MKALLEENMPRALVRFLAIARRVLGSYLFAARCGNVLP
jgi:hypothetical protein